MKGLYNGLESESHRVRLPSLTAIDAVFGIQHSSEIQSYHFNCRTGYLISIFGQPIKLIFVQNAFV